MGELRELGRLYGNKLNALIGDAFTPHTIRQAEQMTIEYCRQVDIRWGITLRYTVQASHERQSIHVDVEPATEFDKAMWERLQETDTKVWMMDPRAIGEVPPMPHELNVPGIAA